MNALKTWYEGAKARFESLPFRTLRIVVAHPGGAPIIAKDADTPHDPASLTKLMNFYVACSMAKTAPANIPITEIEEDELDSRQYPHHRAQCRCL